MKERDLKDKTGSELVRIFNSMVAHDEARDAGFKEVKRFRTMKQGIQRIIKLDEVLTRAEKARAVVDRPAQSSKHI